MMKFSAVLAAALTGASVAYAADLSTMKKSPATPATSCFADAYSYFNATAQECPLTWNGITPYAVIDTGFGYMSHGEKLNASFPNGVASVIAKYSQNGRWTFVPGGNGQSSYGMKLNYPAFYGWSLVGQFEGGFDPYTLTLASGIQSLLDNNNRKLAQQSANGDSSRAGQWYNSVLYGGISNKPYGTLTYGRQLALPTEIYSAYDPMGGSYAFSLLSSGSVVQGFGVTENARANSSIKYRYADHGIRLAVFAEIGGYEQGNAAKRLIQGQIGGDYGNLSLDAVIGHATDAYTLSLYSTATTIATPAQAGHLKASLADTTGGVIMARYTWNAFKFYGGYENVHFANPSDAYAKGFTVANDVVVLPGAVTANAYTINRVMQAVWTGARYALNEKVDLSAAYTYQWQNNYNTAICTGSSISTSSNKCAGNLNVYSLRVEYRPLKRIELYAGLMYSKANGGMASGYIHSDNFAPTAGMRIRF